MPLKANIHEAFRFSFRFLPNRAALEKPDSPRQHVTHFVSPAASGPTSSEQHGTDHGFLLMNPPAPGMTI